jgi:hypothetical protein
MVVVANDFFRAARVEDGQISTSFADCSEAHSQLWGWTFLLLAREAFPQRFQYGISDTLTCGRGKLLRQAIHFRVFDIQPHIA